MRLATAFNALDERAVVVPVGGHYDINQIEAGLFEDELYSKEHGRKFTTERAGFQVVKDPKDRSKLVLAINGQLIGEWFRNSSIGCFHPYEKMLCRLKVEKVSDNKN